jgi:hypothetical protein
MRFVFYFILLFSSCISFSQNIPDKWLTPYELSGFKSTPRYEETMAYCRKLEKASPWIKVINFGKSPQGRDLPLVIASKEKAFDPKRAWKTNKAIVLIQNGIHAGEIDGKDACLMLLRDIAITKTKLSLLDHVILLIIPIYNVDGHERFGPYNRINQKGPEQMGWRVTAQNLNLNRDYIKADAPETQAWLKLFNAWLPDFFVDCHVTDGADYQHAVTYGIETHDNVAQPVRSWIKEKYLPVLSNLKTGDVPVAPYIFFRDNNDARKGLIGGTAPPRFSTVYVSLQNRPGLLIETHMLKDYKTRVTGTYQLLDATLEQLNREYQSLRSAVRRADEETADGVVNPFPLQFDLVDTPNGTVHLYGYKSITQKSYVSGTDRLIFTADPFDTIVPQYDSIKVKSSVIPPVAYLIPPQWQQVIERLKLHGLQLERLKTPARLDAEFYKFSTAKWQEAPFEGHHQVSYKVEKFVQSRLFHSGTVVLWLHQRAAKVAIHALEPEAPDAFSAWGFFDAIFEQKEYAEDYVMEAVAEQMLHEDSHLQSEFVEKLKSDTTFAKSPSARLNFFYQHSPYWDEQMNIYPVARLMSKATLSTEPLR